MVRGFYSRRDKRLRKKLNFLKENRPRSPHRVQINALDRNPAREG